MGTFYHDQPLRAIVRLLRISLFLLAACPAAVFAQSTDSVAAAAAKVRAEQNYWPRVALGAVASILAHEAGHVGTSLALGKHPTFGFDKFRPTVYSGLNSHVEPRDQFFFSAAGLTVQSVIDEAILDIPHSRGSAFERGVLGGGIGTTLFYLTLGRRGSVSDVDFMARTHVMSITQVTVLYGAIAAMHMYRISRDKHYANFFARPRAGSGMDVGVSVGPF
jgi:hypothetical protein